MIFRRSIRWYIQLWYGALLVLVTAGLLTGFYHYERKVWIQHLDGEMVGPLISLLPRYIRLPGQNVPPLSQPEEPSFEKILEQKGYYIGAWTGTDELIYLSANAPTDIHLPKRAWQSPKTVGRWNGANYELLQITPRADVVLLGMPSRLIGHHLRTFALKLICIGIVVIAGGLLGGWWVAGRAIQPIVEITSTAEQIASGKRSERIAIRNTHDELGRLASVLNDAFSQLAESYDEQLRFTADASHELRTPVTVILAQTQMALARERDSASYREALQTCQRSAERMKRLLGELLDLSQYDAGEPELRLRECDLGEVLRESLDFISPLAMERKVQICEAIESIHGRFDPIRLSHVFINLLINAVKHNPEGCSITVAATRNTNGGGRVTISDTGTGIPAESLPHIFDRFYRVDKARSRTTGGSGLGLAISKAIVEAHGGTLCADSVVGQGTVFTILLPTGSS